MIELFLCGLRCGVFLIGALGLLAVLGLVIVLILWKTIGFSEEKTVTVELDQDEYEKLSRMLEEYDSRYDDGFAKLNKILEEHTHYTDDGK